MSLFLSHSETLFFIILTILYTITPPSHAQKVTRYDPTSIQPYTTSLPSDLKKLKWAGVHQSKSCIDHCWKVCLRLQLGENCAKACGCVLSSNIIFALLEDGQLYRTEDTGKEWVNTYPKLKQAFDDWDEEQMEFGVGFEELGLDRESFSIRDVKIK